MFKEEQEKMTQEIQSFVNKFENKYNKKLQVIVSELGSSKVNNYTKMWKNEIINISIVTWKMF